MTKLYQLEAKSRLFGEAYSRVDLGSLLADSPYLGVVIKQADSYMSVPTISRTYDNGLNDDINKYIENAIAETSRGVSYVQAMKTASQGVGQVLKLYQINK